MQQNTSSTQRRGLLKWLGDMARVFRNEWAVLLRDFGALVFFIVLPLGYPIVYTLIYNTEIVTELPVAVVDNSRSEASRDLVRRFTASPSVALYDYCDDMAEAKRLFAQDKVCGILEIPRDYSHKIARVEPSTVTFYGEMSLLLRYRAFMSALADVQIGLTEDISAERMASLGVEPSGGSGLPVEHHNTFLGPSGQGFASFVMPGILILVLQQSMVLGICLLCGTAAERRRRNGGIDPMAVNDASSAATLWGKALCYFTLYLPLVIYVVHFIPTIFGLPHIGNPVDYLLFLVPLLLASAMFGLTLQGFCTEREYAFLVIVFTSVVFLFLSGLSWPRYSMNGLWIWLGNIVPATWGVEGFIRINSNGASLAEAATPYCVMWILTAVYFLAALWVTSRQRRYAK